MTNATSTYETTYARLSRPVLKSRARAPGSLAQAVEAAVDCLDPESLTALGVSKRGSVLQSRALLASLAFCYARQVYSSKTIAAQLLRDPKLRLAGVQLPDAQILQQFRQNNRVALKFCLQSALLFLADEKVRQGVVTHVKEAHMREEAGRRIVMAMFTDSLENDPSPGASPGTNSYPYLVD
ncbi:MAG TPA: hypothetical protein VKY92_23740 [Verrucomicrobiae bacterium]|nr:hypothetical protein [Verrucomicrobiae bacterium]